MTDVSGSPTDAPDQDWGPRMIAVVAIVAVGQVVVAATLSTADVSATIAAEALLLGLLLVPFVRGPAPVRSALVFLLVLAGLGGVAWATMVLAESLWLLATGIAVVAVPVAYYLHRYARVVAGRYGEVPSAA